MTDLVSLLIDHLDTPAAPQGPDRKSVRAALQGPLGRGARKGRAGWQFARDWAERLR